MKKIKVIDLLNKIANGEIDEDIKIEFQYGYNYEYCTIREFFDRYILDKENLNQEITLEDAPKEETKIPEKIKVVKDNSNDIVSIIYDDAKYDITILQAILIDNINAIIDYLKNKGDDNEQ